MVPMAIAVGASKTRDDHVRAKRANYTHHVAQHDIVTLPFPKSLVGGFRESEVGDASETLLHPVVAVGCG